MNLDIFEQKVATARRMMYQGVQDMSAESWEFISQTRELTRAIQSELLSRAEGRGGSKDESSTTFASAEGCSANQMPLWMISPQGLLCVRSESTEHAAVVCAASC